MPKLLGLNSRVRFWNSMASTFDEVTVVGFGHPPMIRVARSSAYREEDRVIEIKESDVVGVYNAESCLWETYPGYNKEIPIPC